MVQNKKVAGALALVAAVLAMSVSGSALALPEMEVGTLPPFVAPDSASSLDSTVAAPDVEDESDTAS